MNLNIFSLKINTIHLFLQTNLEECEFRRVLAFPNASNIGFDSKIICWILLCFPVIEAKNCNNNLVDSVLPIFVKMIKDKESTGTTFSTDENRLVFAK